jgi:hypothetical protein
VGCASWKVSAFVAAPLGGLTLAQLGADVIRWLTGHADGGGARTAGVRGDGVVAMTLDAD